MPSDCGALNQNPAFSRRILWLCAGALLTIAIFVLTDGAHGAAGPDSILMEQKAERREYVLVDDDRPSRNRVSYRDEERVYHRDGRYSLAQDDRYERRDRGREDRRVVIEDEHRDNKEQVLGRSDRRETLLSSDDREDEKVIRPREAIVEETRESDVGKSSKTWFSSLETTGPGLIDQVYDSVYHLYLAATGQSGRMSRHEGIDNARILAKFVNRQNPSTSQLKFTASNQHTSEVAQTSDSKPVTEEVVEEKASSASLSASETDANSDSEKLAKLAKQVDEMTALAEKNQEKIDSNAVPQDKAVEIDALGQQVQGIESVNAKNQQDIEQAPSKAPNE